VLPNDRFKAKGEDQRQNSAYQKLKHREKRSADGSTEFVYRKNVEAEAPRGWNE
jgi:hypothetical protein